MCQNRGRLSLCPLSLTRGKKVSGRIVQARASAKRPQAAKESKLALGWCERLPEFSGALKMQ